MILNCLHHALVLYHTLYLPFGKKRYKKFLEQPKPTPHPIGATFDPQYSRLQMSFTLVSSLTTASRGESEGVNFAQKILANNLVIFQVSININQGLFQPA